MGVIAAAFGMALASADHSAATNIAFYAANHVLVKAALFLTVGGRRCARRPRPNAGPDRRGVARLEPRRIAADRRRARQARRQEPVRRRRRWRSVAAVCGGHHGAHADIRHAACPLAPTGRWAVAFALVVVGRAGARRLARSLAHVCRRRKSSRGVRTRRSSPTRSGRCWSAPCWPPVYGRRGIGYRTFPQATLSSPRRQRSAHLCLLARRSSGPIAACGNGRRRASLCLWSHSRSRRRDGQAGRS